MNKALKVYQDYVALKAHYTRMPYDYFMSNGKTKASKTSFERRNDKNYFITLSNQKDYFKYLIANIAYSNYWVGDIALNDMADTNYKTFKRRSESLTYTIMSDLKKMNSNFKSNFTVNKSHPQLLIQYFED